MASTPDRRPRLPVTPLAPAALGAIAGVVLDRYGVGSRWTSTAWAIVAIVGSLLAVIAGRTLTRLGRCGVIVAFVALAGGWHHYWWSDLNRDDLAHGDRKIPKPAWVRGVLLEKPEFRPPDRPDRSGYSQTILAVTASCDGQRWHSASGRLLVLVSGEVKGLRAGEPVEGAGLLGSISGPLNPGETDARERWRGRGVRLRLSIDEPAGLWRDPTGSIWPLSYATGYLRQKSNDILVSGLNPEIAPLAAALLLGRREKVDPDDNDAFARTGTMHLLAISGLHLQALAWTLWWFGVRFLGLSRKPAFWVVILLTVSYAALVGFMPSVVRSAAMTTFASLAGLRDRYTRAGNMLSLAALATLAWNPSDLFDVGCQLSFLGVAALVWGVPIADRLINPWPEDPLDALERRYEPIWRRALRWPRTWLLEGITLSTVVWLVGLPLAALRFHLVSPISILLNLPLVPITSLALMAAGLSLLLSIVWPPLATPASWLCALLMKWTQSVVRWGAAQNWGHMFTPGPSLSWVLVFYGLLSLSLIAGAARWRVRWGLRLGLLIWVVVGLASAFGPAPRPSSLEGDVLAVGHGLSIVIRSPDGHTLLYDCGKMGDPHVGRRLIAPALWARGVRRIDVLALSHADSDHFNALPDLLDRFPVGEVRIPPGFGGAANPEAVRLLGTVRARGVPVRTLVAGDRLDLGRGTDVEVLHPPRDWLPTAPDNDRSLVLAISSAGRQMLLTGDLDGAGLAEVRALPTRSISVFLSPHHGGRSANPPWLYDWARPSRVVVSQRAPNAGAKDALTPLERRGVSVLRTWQTGAVHLIWYDTGLSAVGFLEERDRSRGSSVTLEVASLNNSAKGSPVVQSHFGSSVLATVLGLVVGFLSFLTLVVIEWGAWALVRPGRKLVPHELEPPPWEPIEVFAADGIRLAGAWLSAEDAEGRTAVLLHGFAEDRAALLGRALALHQRGWNVALVDARGRGRSEGDLCSFGGREVGDLRRWIDVLTERSGQRMRLVAWGRSMGAAIALRAAAEDVRISALVLEAPYPDLAITVAAWLHRVRLPGVFASPILRRAKSLAGVSLEYPRPIDVAPAIQTPTLIVHGADDSIVSLDRARLFAAAFTARVGLVEISGARHSDVFDIGGSELADRIAAFAANGVIERAATSSP
jgi:competence protein ComEC